MASRAAVLLASAVAALTVPGYASYRRKRWLKSRRQRVIVFTRYPAPGTTKSRLIPALGEQGAALAQLHMTDAILHEAGRLQQRNPEDLSVEVRYHGGTQEDMRYWLERRTGISCWWRVQEGEDLGQKMANAFKDAFREGTENVVLVGSDIPAITADILEEALQTLNSSQEEDVCVLGPAIDGGYYLVGLNRQTDSRVIGRGMQLNAGSQHASGDYLLFLHADTQLPSSWQRDAYRTLCRPGVVVGAFPFGLDVVQDSSHSKRQFQSVGGFPEFPLLEDVEMLRRLKRHGHVGITEGSGVITSARRFRKHGYLKVTSLNTFILLAYQMGVHPDTLAVWYYGRKVPDKD
ncbi:PREDICTED: uncharacterized protein LOC109473060 [Branchiostoma belcheri]|uniref:Uncharacterized protein LOC109473060 n=1 Tax=Branchiostoma belcheri TaxID=7741 RepID=A0A6P4YGW9_BRABE|nr:PREDICTED: uncharacterized protein LOC109473060 [Branchiostoma belcheri]